MRKLVLVVLALCSMTIFAVTPASAVALSNTAISFGTDFLSVTPFQIASNLDDFDFDPLSDPYDGTVYSYVFTNSTRSVYGYVYQIDVLGPNPPSTTGSSDEVKGFSVDFWGLIGQTVGTTTVTSFREFTEFGGIVPSQSSISSSEVLSFSFFGDPIVPGTSSTYFGAFSYLPPALVTANLLDTSQEVSPDVLAPVPEPGTMILLGSGLVGLAGWGRKKFRK